ncbi:MAG: amino acid ABC transporter permease [Acidiferrobacterales bacterium]|nr:amino acid ABC transporter permease [Acidiferrobacterales bacterium]
MTKYAFPLIAFTVLAVFAYFLNWDLLLSLDFSVVWEYRVVLLKGLMVTLGLTACAAVSGLLFGTVLAIASQSAIAPLRWLVIAFVEIWRNTPLLVQLIWIHFALPLVTGINTTALESGVIGITLQASAYFTEIVRAGIESVPKGQWEAAYSLALPSRIRWTRVILPPAIRTMIPPLVNLTISFFKGTAILSILHVSELMTVTNRISNVTFKPVELFSAIAVIYFIVGIVMSKTTLRLEYFLQKRER